MRCTDCAMLHDHSDVPPNWAVVSCTCQFHHDVELFGGVIYLVQLDTGATRACEQPCHV